MATIEGAVGVRGGRSVFILGSSIASRVNDLYTKHTGDIIGNISFIIPIGMFIVTEAI